MLAVTAAAYYPAWHGGILWDDAAHLTRPALQSLHGLWRIWFELGATQQYYPVVHSTFWLAHRIWGDFTLGYHLLNIVLHSLSAFLVLVILRRLRVPWPGLAAAIFALHPVQVESVAWMTELKNTLSGALFLGAALAYLSFDQQRRKPAYALALVLFVLALFSKSVTAVLPGILLVVFWWQRGRLDPRRDVLPLAPFFAVGAAAGLMTAWVERAVIGAQGAQFQFSFAERLLIAGRAIWFYLGKLAWPASLTFVYPRWDLNPRDLAQWLYPVGVVALLAALWLLRRRSRAPLAAMLVFCGTLFPALGFLNVYPFRFSFVADHFQYLACIAVFALASAALAYLARRVSPAPRAAAATATLAIATLLAVLSSNQSAEYADAEVLYRATILKNPSCWLAYSNLGKLELESGRLEQASSDIREALRIRPDVAEAHTNLGFVLQRTGHVEQAIVEHTEALRLDPALDQAHNNLATALLSLGRVDDAIAHYQAALRLKPDLPEALTNLGVAMFRKGQVDRAIELHRRAIRSAPDYLDAHYNLALTFQRVGRLEEAVPEYFEALRLQGDAALIHRLLGQAFEQLGRTEEAVSHYREAQRINPGLEDLRTASPLERAATRR